MAESEQPLENSTKAELRALLQGRGLTLKKRWGQNFLYQTRWRRWIVELVDPSPGERIWEVGPGLGSLTEGLLFAGADLTLFEIDYGLISYLRERFGEKVQIVEGDAVKTCRRAAAGEGPPEKVVGNLPYSSGAKIIASFIESPLIEPPPMVVMVQREVAERMAAPAGGTDYSSFTVLVASSYTVRLEGDVPPEAFFPPPRVKSTVVTLTPRKNPLPPSERLALGRVARALFGSRRKTIRNTIKAAFTPVEAARLYEALEKMEIPLERRGEELDFETFRVLAQTVAQFG